jgi:hypothetical protein
MGRGGRSHSRRADAVKPENVEYIDAPEGIEATWYVAHGTLFIALATDLDQITRQRYIMQAKAEHGIESTRRRLTIPILLPAGGFGAASPARKATVVGVGAVAAAGIATAVILPAALGGNTNAVQRHPSAEAPAPRKPAASRGMPSPSHPPTSPPPGSQAPAPADSPDTAGGLPVVRHVTSSTLPGLKPARVLPRVAPSVTVPIVSHPPDQDRPLLKHVCVTVDLLTHVRVGCGRVLSRSRP